MVIVEGIDGTGKTSIVTELKNRGLKNVSYNYDKKTQSFATKYFNIDLDTVKEGVSDRSFISEVAKGNLVRGICRLSDDEYEKLLEYYGSFGTIIIYLKANKDVLLERRKDDFDDFKMISELYDAIDSRYDEVINIAKKYIKVYTFNTSKTTVNEIMAQIDNLIFKASSKDSSEVR